MYLKCIYYQLRLNFINNFKERIRIKELKASYCDDRVRQKPNLCFKFHRNWTQRSHKSPWCVCNRPKSMKSTKSTKSTKIIIFCYCCSQRRLFEYLFTVVVICFCFGLVWFGLCDAISFCARCPLSDARPSLQDATRTRTRKPNSFEIYTCHKGPQLMICFVLLRNVKTLLMAFVRFELILNCDFANGHFAKTYAIFFSFFLETNFSRT